MVWYCSCKIAQSRSHETHVRLAQVPLHCYNALETCLGTRISALQLRGGRQCSGSVARRVHDGLLTQMPRSQSQIAQSACEASANAIASLVVVWLGGFTMGCSHKCPGPGVKSREAHVRLGQTPLHWYIALKSAWGPAVWRCSCEMASSAVRRHHCAALDAGCSSVVLLIKHVATRAPFLCMHLPRGIEH